MEGLLRLSYKGGGRGRAPGASSELVKKASSQPVALRLRLSGTTRLPYSDSASLS